MKHNGVLHIVANNDGSYMVKWSPAGGGGWQPHRTLLDDAHLEQFLGGVLGIDQEQVTQALKALREAPPGQKRYVIPEVWLSAEEARQHGVAPG